MHATTARFNPAPVDSTVRDAVIEAPEFGSTMTDHMVTMTWSDQQWGPLELRPFEPLSLSPATLALHYGQSMFEALKAYAQPDGAVALFRPSVNARRFATSGERLAMPALPAGAFEQACEMLVDVDRAWVPDALGAALYVRPFMFGCEPHLSVRPATKYLFVVIASPVASYFGPNDPAITVAVETKDVRAALGGTGAVKFAGNYSAGFAAHARAHERGADQVMWLDAVEHRWVEELNAMNVMAVTTTAGRRVLRTPPLGGTILPGVTRMSLLDLAVESGLVDRVEVAPIAIDELLDEVRSGVTSELFACGTAAVVAPIGRVLFGDEDVVVGSGEPGAVTVAIRDDLVALQSGRRPDPHGWLSPVGDEWRSALITGPA